MLTPAILLFVLIVATAVIAYWSDNLGKKLGKKRISIFGLRPRQTATVITIGSSQIIMLVTLLSLLGIYAPLRHALLYYDTERARNRGLVRDNEQLAQQQSDLNRKIETTGDQLRQTEKSLGDARQATSLARNATQKARTEAQTANLSAQTARSNESAAKSRERAARADESAARSSESAARRGENTARVRAESLRVQFASTNRRLQNASSRLYQIERRLQQANIRVQRAGVRLRQASARLKQTGAELKVAARNLSATNRNLTTVGKAWSEVQNQYSQLNAEYDQQKTQYDRQKIDYDQQKADLQNLRAQAADARQSLAVAAIAVTGPTMVSNEETLADTTIGTQQTASEIDATLRALMNTARARVQKIAIDSGVDTSRNALSLRLVSRASADIDEARILGLLTGFLSNATSPVSVRVIAARNHALGESEIVAQLVTVPIRAAFAAGETIASATIAARQSDAQIFNQLLALLNAGQRVAEAERGVEPPLSRDTLFYAPGTNERIFEALRLISASDAPVRVRLNAASNVSTAEPMRVTFAVDRAPDNVRPPGDHRPENSAPSATAAAPNISENNRRNSRASSANG